MRNLVIGVLLIWLCGLTMTAGPVIAQSYSDGFEGSSIGSWWTQCHGGTTTDATLSSTVAHTGSNSIRCSNSAGGNVGLKHTWSVPQYGDLSVWYYDDLLNPERITFETLLGASSHELSIWTGSSKYNITDDGTPMGGPVRSSGWHQFTISVTSTRYALLVDGAVVSSGVGFFSFNSVGIYVNGLSSGSTAYIDDFSFTPPSVPEPPALLALLTGISGLSGLMWKRRR